MGGWVINAIALLVGAFVLSLFSLALLWRLGARQVGVVTSLVFDEGLRVGTRAPQVAAYRGASEVHLGFVGQPTFVVFGNARCEPCKQLLAAAARHPATRHLRKVYVGDSEDLDVDPDLVNSWEIYRFHDEASTRRTWRAPVSPYFYYVSSTGAIQDKGIANRPEHLDRLLAVRPTRGGR